MGKAIVAILLALTLAGCTTFGQPPRTGSLCTAGPILPDKGFLDRWTPGEVDQLVVLNESGEQVCGWKP